MKKEKCCGTIILHNNRVLVLRQKQGHLSFPKGHVEDNETEIETALRETKEETNLDVEIISEKRYINSYTMENGIYKDVIFFLAKPLNIENLKVCDKEISEYYWLLYDEVLNEIKYEDTKILWNEVLKDII